MDARFWNAMYHEAKRDGSAIGMNPFGWGNGKNRKRPKVLAHRWVR